MHLLFDLDMTLLNFDKEEKHALSTLFNILDIPLSLLPVYHKANRICWNALEAGEMDIPNLRVARFARFFQEINSRYSPEKADYLYTELLKQHGTPFPGVTELLERLKTEHSIHIITNGISEVQTGRLESSHLLPYISSLFISEQIGRAKPDPLFFQVVKETLNVPDRKIVVIGDSLSSDITGGNRAGLTTIWYNPQKKENTTGAAPTYIYTESWAQVMKNLAEGKSLSPLL